MDKEQDPQHYGNCPDSFLEEFPIMATQTSSPLSDDPQQHDGPKRMLCYGRLLAGCFTLAAALLVWNQQYEYSEKKKNHRLGDPSVLWRGGRGGKKKGRDSLGFK